MRELPFSCLWKAQFGRRIRVRKFLASLWRSEAGRWTPGGVLVVGVVVAYGIGQRSGWLSLEFLLTVAIFSFLSVLDFYSAGWFHRSHEIRSVPLGVGSDSGDGLTSEGGR